MVSNDVLDRPAQAIADAPCGLLRGRRVAGGSVLRFLGIPYAQPPVGALRWRPPHAIPRWDGVRPATQSTPACIQPSLPRNSLVYGGEEATSEDCLTLNVWTGSLDAAERRPVIVWLHHGGFMMGWGQAPLYDGAALARRGAVFVTINYRLGRLGFLAHPALSAESPHRTSGNYGLLDQISALHWVQENIAAFGGDPACVTLYGISAGGFSISALMASPLAAGLFHRAVGGSGGAFGPTGTSSEIGDLLQDRDSAEALGAATMARLGARTAEALRALLPQQVLAAKEPQFWRARRGLLDTTYPILDGHVLPEPPAERFRAGRHNDVPLITGSATHESSIVPFNEDAETFELDSRDFLGSLYSRFAALFPSGPGGLAARASAAANADRLFSWQNWTWARLQAAFGRSPVHYYRFAHVPPVPPGSVAEQAMNEDVGAFHSAELPYTLDNLAARDWPWRDADRTLSATMSGYLLDFARTGNPNGGGRPAWPAFTLRGQAIMRFDAAPHCERAPDSETFLFWDEVYSSLARRAGAPAYEFAA